MPRKLPKSLGFTLIELMVSISVVAILAVVGFTVYGDVQKKARDTKRMGDVAEIQKALEQYYAINRDYPNNSSTDYTNKAETALSSLTSYFQNNSIPLDPKTGTQDYQYIAGGTCGGSKLPKYFVCAKLEDPSGKTNMDSLPSNGCASLSSSGSTYYCLTALSQ